MKNIRYTHLQLCMQTNQQPVTLPDQLGLQGYKDRAFFIGTTYLPFSWCTPGQEPGTPTSFPAGSQGSTSCCSWKTQSHTCKTVLESSSAANTLFGNGRVHKVSIFFCLVWRMSLDKSLRCYLHMMQERWNYFK